MPVAVSKPDYYAILELENGATEDEIRVAYKKLALKWHPDRHQEHKDEAQEKFVEVQNAYLHLCEDNRHRNKRKARKTKSEPGKSSTSSVHTAASGSSASSERSEARSTPEKSRRGSHKQKERRTEEGPHRPPDTGPSATSRKPRKLSKQAPLRPDRHGNHSHARSERDHSTDDESYSSKSKSKKPRRSKSGDNLAAESDFEFVEFADLGTPLPPLRSPKLRGGATPDEKDWIFPLPLTLEELYHGVSQNYRITRTLRSGQTQSVKIHLRVSPSWQDGARVRVPGVGNERADGSFQDIVFVVEEQPHAAFARAGDDVLVSVQVPWADAPPRPYSSTSDATEDDADAFGEEAVYVRALGGREYSVPIPRSLVEAADGTRIVGAGMPVRKGGKLLGRGDLIIKWEFAFADADKGQRQRWQQLKKAMHWKL